MKSVVILFSKKHRWIHISFILVWKKVTFTPKTVKKGHQKKKTETSESTNPFTKSWKGRLQPTQEKFVTSSVSPNSISLIK